MADTGQTIIIKKIKKGGHGHHGGAWKVAYADFVTAMMAFFLLMWLLNATEAESLSGLADYFAPTIGVKDNMGIGFRGGKSALSKGVGADKNTNKGIIFGGMPAGPIVKVTERIEQETDEPEDEKVMLLIGKSGTTDFSGTEEGVSTPAPEEATEKQAAQSLEELSATLQSHLNDVAREAGLEQTVAIVQTTEGLELQIQDTAGNAMFKHGTAELEEPVQKALAKLAEVLGQLPNYLAITGHTSSVPVSGRKDYSNWELSTDRANAVRRFLIQSGIQPEQIERVIGKSDNEPVDTKRPAAPVNNRISIVLLRDAALPEHKLGAPRGVFIDPSSADAKALTEDDPQAEQPADIPAGDGTSQEDSSLRDVIRTTESQSDSSEIEPIVTEPELPESLPDNAPTRAESAADAFFPATEAQPVMENDPATEAINRHLLQEDATDAPDPLIDSLQVQDPFAAGLSPQDTLTGAASPSDIIAPAAQEPQKTEALPRSNAVNNHLLAEDPEEETTEDMQNLPVQDPFRGGAIGNPLDLP